MNINTTVKQMNADLRKIALIQLVLVILSFIAFVIDVSSVFSLKIIL